MIKHVLVTGAAGFIGKNLVLALRRIPDIDVIGTDMDTSPAELSRALAVCDVVIHLAGVNRPENDREFEQGNVDSLAHLLSDLEGRRRFPLVVLSSSTQALLGNPYGRSKKRAEEILLDYSGRTGAPVRIYRLPGVFGKWCRPHYNSVVATFCHDAARGLPLQISDRFREIELVHVDDVVAALIRTIREDRPAAAPSSAIVEPVFKVSLGNLADLIERFKASRETLVQPDLRDPFVYRLLSTYLSYLPKEGFAYTLVRKADSRGELAELLKLDGHGQIFVSRTHPGITRGDHYHELKFEKFVVLHGQAAIRFRQMSTQEVVEYLVQGSEMRVVDIPPGWTHSIENIGASEMIVLFWASEVFDAERPDTYTAKVKI